MPNRTSVRADLRRLPPRPSSCFPTKFAPSRIRPSMHGRLALPHALEQPLEPADAEFSDLSLRVGALGGIGPNRPAREEAAGAARDRQPDAFREILSVDTARQHDPWAIQQRGQLPRIIA